MVANKFKRLAIISDCVHMYDASGNAVTEVHIFCRQMQVLASMFQQTVICCPFVPYSDDKVTTAYTNNTINFIPLPNAGGNTVKDKLKLLTNIPAWLKGFRQAGKQADVVYLRFPNNLNIIGFFYFYFKGSKTFATYTGTWANYGGEPLTYRFQKWLLKHFFKGPAWLYIHEEKMGKNLFKGISPSYTRQEWEEETDQVTQRIERLNTQGIGKPVFVTVGGLNQNKNQQYILNACKVLHEEGFDFKLYVVGDGELKAAYQQFVTANSLQHCIEISGKKNYTQLRQIYREADFLIQATLVEGFGKVPIEGFFHGVVPMLNRVALAGEMTGNGKRGFVFDAGDVYNLVTLIKQAVTMKQQLVEMIVNGREYAKTHTLQNWAEAYVTTINEYYKI